MAERRTDAVFLIDLSGATDITELEDGEGRLLNETYRSLEQLPPADLAAYGVQPVKKTLIIAPLTSIALTHDKVEGMALVGSSLVLCQDNDFGIFGLSLFRDPVKIVVGNAFVDTRLVVVPVGNLPVSEEGDSSQASESP